MDTFPILSANELVKTYQMEFGLKMELSKELFARGHTSYWKQVYIDVLAKYHDVPVETIYQNLRPKINSQYSYIYEEGDILLKLVFYMRTVLKKIILCQPLFSDFNSFDIYAPEPKRIRIIFSSFLNAIRYRTTINESFNSIMEKNKSAEENIRELEISSNMLRNAIENLSLANERDSTILKQLSDEVMGIRQNSKVLLDEYNEFKKIYDNIINEENEINKEILMIQRQIEEGDELVQSLSSNIVSNPGEAKAEFEFLSKKETELRTKMEKTSSQIMQLKNDSHALSIQVDPVLSALNNNISHIFNDEMLYKNNEKEIVELEQELKQLKMNLDNRELNLNNLNEELIIVNNNFEDNKNILYNKYSQQISLLQNLQNEESGIRNRKEKIEAQTTLCHEFLASEDSLIQENKRLFDDFVARVTLKLENHKNKRISSLDNEEN